VLPHGDGLLDEVVKVFGRGGSETGGLEDTEDLVARHALHLGEGSDEHEDRGHRICTCGMPCESRSTMPICDGVMPLRASLKIWSATSVGVALTHLGGERL
jgi:hypothetical protein